MPHRSPARFPTLGSVLATDLDGTLIPLEGDAQNRADLVTLAAALSEQDVLLVFVTGRHMASVAEAIQTHQLPRPDWVICDVGTSIYQRDAAGQFVPIAAYAQHLQQIIAPLPIDALRHSLAAVPGLRLQEQEKQGPFKLSFYADQDQLESLVQQLETRLTDAPYSIIQSVDPFNGEGLIDLMPTGVSKAYALRWWSDFTERDPGALVFAGDSGNDLAALTAGYRAIVVGNTERQVVRQVYQQHQATGWQNRLCIARGTATSGVLEGCRWFELLESDPAATRRLGATPRTYDRTQFRVWAPQSQQVEVELLRANAQPSRHALLPESDGYFSGLVPGAPPQTDYRYVLAGADLAGADLAGTDLAGTNARPDPASSYQPEGVHGPSQVVAPGSFPWTDAAWQGVCKEDLVLYELHLGAWAGTFRAATERLEELVTLGVTAVQLMPVAQTPGRWNWGYDGVDLFAVRNTYGEPDDFKQFVDACHGHGLAVLLDVVYNHVGPEGNYLANFGPYFSTKHHTPWGEAFNFDGPQSAPVRQFVLENALRWLDEFHLDGLRLDAVHCMHDDSSPNILAEIRTAVSAYAATTDRRLHLVAETNVYDSKLLSAAGSGAAYDATWCDCLMYSIYAHARPDLELAHRTYHPEGDLAEALVHGFLYCHSDQGPLRVDAAKRAALAATAGPPPRGSFVTALQTHDSVGNHPRGSRLHHLTSKAFQRAAAPLTLLSPGIPLLFMGEEYASDSPFPFFADFLDPQLRAAVDAGRLTEYPQSSQQDTVPPSAAHAFRSAQSPESRDLAMTAWYQQLLKLRKEGLSAGWLSAAHLTTRHDPQRDLFTLHYAPNQCTNTQSSSESTGLKIQVRLARPGNESPVAIALPGELLLSSAPVERDASGHLLLQPNHAIITSV